MDEANEANQLDQVIFDRIVPLPYRILFLIQLGHTLWYLIVYGCYKLNHMNVLELINLSYSSHNYPQIGGPQEVGEQSTVLVADIKENDLLLNGIWFNLKIISINTMVSFIIFKTMQFIFEGEDHHSSLILIYHLIPLITMLVISYRLFNKSKNSKSIGKLRLSSTMQRILLGRINSTQMRTNDILISDSLMSYSKVLNDIGIFIWHYFVSDEIRYNDILEFSILCYPTMIRIKQCWNEFVLTAEKQHFFNLMKYASGIGPVFINFLIKFNLEEYGEDEGEDKQNHLKFLHSLNMWWYFFSFINSTYSFIWDIKMDWGFQIFDRISSNNPTILIRPSNKLIYNSVVIYYLAIVVDFILRYLWVMKFLIIQDAQSLPIINRVSLFLFGYDAFSFGYCLIEVLEIFRRFMWCFFKLENDWFKLDHTVNIELTKLG